MRMIKKIPKLHKKEEKLHEIMIKKATSRKHINKTDKNKYTWYWIRHLY